MSDQSKDNVKDCCDEMQQMLEDDYLITALNNDPFTSKEQGTTVYISSDGGHGGMKEISYCPFCGTKIVTKPRKDHVSTEGF